MLRLAKGFRFVLTGHQVLPFAHASLCLSTARTGLRLMSLTAIKTGYTVLNQQISETLVESRGITRAVVEGRRGSDRGGWVGGGLLFSC